VLEFALRGKGKKTYEVRTAESTTAVQPPLDACASAKPGGASQLLAKKGIGYEREG
jgi:hypothetical protein